MRLTGIFVLIMAAFIFSNTAIAQPVFPPAGKPEGSAAPAPAAGAQITALTAAQVAQLLNEAGFPSKVVENAQHEHWVVTEFWGKDLYAGVTFAGKCENDACNVLEIFGNFGKPANVDQAWVNAWNRSKLFAKAVFFPDGTLIFRYDLALFPSVTPDYVKTSAAVFKVVVSSAADFKP
jgi:hypothetical protein